MTILPATCKSSWYFYEFSMSSGLNYYGNQANEFSYSGYVGHIDDTLYLFPTDKADGEQHRIVAY